MAFRIDPRDLRKAQRDIAKAAPALAAELVTKLNELAELIAQDARAAAPSARIAGSVRASKRAKDPVVRAGGSKAPHAVVWDGRRDGGARKHPVFADGPRSGWAWAAQGPVPFFRRAVESGQDESVRKAVEAIDDAARRSGLTS